MDYNDSLNYDAIYPWGAGKFGDEVHHHVGWFYDSARLTVPTLQQLEDLKSPTFAFEDRVKAMKRLGVDYDHTQPEWLDSIMRPSPPTRSNEGHRVLEFDYMFDQRDVADEESALNVFFVLPPGFTPKIGLTYKIPNENFQVEAWDWGAWVSQNRMMNPVGFVRFEAVEENHVTLVAEIWATVDHWYSNRLRLSTRYYDSLMDRVIRGLAIDSAAVPVDVLKPKEQRTVIAGRVTFVRKALKSGDGD